MDKDKVRKYGYAALGAVAGGYAGSIIGGMLGPAGARIGRLAGSAAGGFFGYQHGGEADTSVDDGSDSEPSVVDPDEPLVDAVFTEP